MGEDLEPEVMVVDFDEGTEPVEFTGKTRIQRAALARQDDQLSIFEGYICEGMFSDEDKQVLKDYSWIHLIDFNKDEDDCLGQSLYANLELQMAEYTAQVLGVEIEYPKHSLVYLVD